MFTATMEGIFRGGSGDPRKTVKPLKNRPDVLRTWLQQPSKAFSGGGAPPRTLEPCGPPDRVHSNSTVVTLMGIRLLRLFSVSCLTSYWIPLTRWAPVNFILVPDTVFYGARWIDGCRLVTTAGKVELAAHFMLREIEGNTANNSAIGGSRHPGGSLRDFLCSRTTVRLYGSPISFYTCAKFQFKLGDSGERICWRRDIGFL